ncbi:CpaE family protein [Paraburkholderia sp. BCC1886]|uniref:AAA family ATPase n=1 Tax=Paraburkholderia sp. BCC1886 TaxID=2562670 RepID=UPI0011837978|nr:AAA family ATPase [Paraburkholderia sp. BCC1886]
MIDIFLLSSSPERASHIVSRIEASGVAYRLRRAYGSAGQICVHKQAITRSSVLIVDDAELVARELDGVEEMLACVPALRCVLIAPAPSDALRGAARRVGVQQVLAWPNETDELVSLLLRLDARQRMSERMSARPSGRIVSFVSPKGGSGTTLIAVNFAQALAASRNRRVLLIDLSRQSADAGLFLATKPSPQTLADLDVPVEQLDARLLEACVMRIQANFHVLTGPRDPLDGAARLQPAQVERVLALARKRYDAVIVDPGSGTDLDASALRAVAVSDSVSMVMQQNPLYLQGARRLLDSLGAQGHAAGTVRMVVNRYDRQARIDLPTLERTLGAKVAHCLPRDDKHADAALGLAVPLVKCAADSALAQGIRLLADILWQPGAGRRETSIVQRNECGL